MTDLENAVNILRDRDYTCVLCKGQQLYTSDRRGVAPLLFWLDAGVSLQGFSAADRVVGKATAFLYVILGVHSVFAGVMSEPAVAVLTRAGIQVEYGTLVQGIQNRTKDGPCPMEHATRNIEDAEEALEAIRSTLEKLRVSS